MHVKEKGNQLIVQTRRRSVVFILIFGLCAVLSGLAVLWVAGRSTALECIRLEAREVSCAVKEAVLGLVVRQVVINQPVQAMLETNADSESGTTYRVALVTSRGAVPLTDYYFGEKDFPSEQWSQVIDRFLDDTTAQAMQLTQPSHPGSYLLLLCFGGVGGVLLLTVRFNTFTFDRERGTLAIKRKALFGTRVVEESLSGLALTVREHSDSDSTSYSVQARTSAGHEINLGEFGYQAEAQRLVRRIEDFLKPGARITYSAVEA